MGCTASGDSITGSQDFHEHHLLGAKLGRGGFAQVRAATKLDDTSSQEMAVKIIDLSGPDRRRMQQRSQREERCWREVGFHPNCNALCEVFHGESCDYMLMERCKCNLLEYIENLPAHQEFTERSLGQCIYHMLKALQHVHSLRIVHRDVKNENFLMGGDDGLTVKLCDFGLSGKLPLNGKLDGRFGTPAFMCPEMLLGGSYDTKADMWSLGVSIYTLLFGIFPFLPVSSSYVARDWRNMLMKNAVIEGANPQFEPVVGNHFAGYRTDNVISLSKSLLQNDPKCRASAEKLLKSEFVEDIVCSRHALGVDLPSLRPMVLVGIQAGTFKMRKTWKKEGIDDVLNSRQIEKHGKPLCDASKMEDAVSCSDDQSTAYTSLSR